ncbi:outer membrane protein assembly factor BamD [Bacteroidota bacterium]
MNRLIILGLVVSIFTSCSEYEKLLKSDDVQLKYDKAFEYYEDKQYVKSATLLQYLTPIYKATDKAAKVEFYYAKSLYGQRDYILAGYHFGEFAKNYGNSTYAEEAVFLNAYCFYLHSPRAALDQNYTYKAIEAFTLFLVKFPNSEKVSESKEILTELNNKLAEKAYINAKLYFDLGYYKSSIVSLRNTINDYPNSKFREELMFLLLKSNFLLAENSVAAKKNERYQNTVDEYYSFIDEFPESKYSKEAIKIYNNSITTLNN